MYHQRNPRNHMLTIKQIYNLAVDLGIKSDLRGQAIVKRKLERVKKHYQELNQKQKAEFDLERLTNPFSDTRYFGNPNKQVKRILTGIDIDVAELLLAKELERVGKAPD